MTRQPGDADESPTVEDWRRLLVLPWQSAEVGPDDRTVTVRFNASFDAGEVAPRLSADLTAAEVVLRLEMVPHVTDGGLAFFRVQAGSPNHSIDLTLPEPLAGRQIVDAWQPPSAPPAPRRVIGLDREFGPVAAGRRVHLDRLEVFDDSMVLHYRLRPGEQDDDDVHLLWDLDVEDDLGTEYEVPSGAYGGNEREITGDREIVPVPPSTAHTLTITVIDVVRGTRRVQRGRHTITLTVEAVRPPGT